MDKVKEFFVLFWASTFNKIWLALVAVAVGLYWYGNKNGWFKSGWKKYLPVIMFVVLLLVFLFKKYILKTSAPSAPSKKSLMQTMM